MLCLSSTHAAPRKLRSNPMPHHGRQTAWLACDSCSNTTLVTTGYTTDLYQNLASSPAIHNPQDIRPYANPAGHETPVQSNDDNGPWCRGEVARWTHLCAACRRVAEKLDDLAVPTQTQTPRLESLLIAKIEAFEAGLTARVTEIKTCLEGHNESHRSQTAALEMEKQRFEAAKAEEAHRREREATERAHQADAAAIASLRQTVTDLRQQIEVLSTNHRVDLAATTGVHLAVAHDLGQTITDLRDLVRALGHRRLDPNDARLGRLYAEVMLAPSPA